MSKTRRKSPREEAADVNPRYVRRIVQPETITEEWALEIMDDRIQWWLTGQVLNGLFVEDERAEYEAMLRKAVSRAAAAYRPERRNAEGQSASAANYIRTSLEHAMNKIANSILDLRQKFTTVPIVSDPPVLAIQNGCISEEDVRLCDECRSVRELDFRMDVRTLFRMLTPPCARYLKLRLAGYTKEEVSERMGLSYYVIRQEILPKLRKKALLCGFEPRSKVEGERPWRKKSEKVSHEIPPEGI